LSVKRITGWPNLILSGILNTPRLHDDVMILGALFPVLDVSSTIWHISGAVSVLQVAIRIGLALRLNLNTSSLLMSDALFSSTLIDGMVQ
jgi:hypothetical protein